MKIYEQSKSKFPCACKWLEYYQMGWFYESGIGDIFTSINRVIQKFSSYCHMSARQSEKNILHEECRLMYSNITNTLATQILSFSCPVFLLPSQVPFSSLTKSCIWGSKVPVNVKAMPCDKQTKDKLEEANTWNVKPFS